MQCQLCGKNLGEYQCSVCKNVVCANCVRFSEKKILCLKCFNIKQSLVVEEKKPVTPIEDVTTRSIKSAILALIFLLLGMLILISISGNYISQLNIPLISEAIISAFKATQKTLIIGVVFVLIILIAAYYSISRKKV